MDMTTKTIREAIEERERQFLAPYATLSAHTKGRAIPILECPIRTAFQRDRDRILYSKAFRRLKHKTQVFLSPMGDHYRTRLTHTLEVAEIARTLCRALRLNEDLAEAIALGHDQGHTPFGHAGETILNEIVPSGFSHTQQSLRIVERLENGGKGLNLTYEVRDGIAKHSKGFGDIIPKNDDAWAVTVEGKIVRLSDIIAYLRSRPVTGGFQPAKQIGPVGRIGVLIGKFKSAPQMLAEIGAVTPIDLGPVHSEGRTLTRVCTECHGADLKGRESLGAPDLTVAATYDLAGFQRLLRTGVASGNRRLGLMSEVAPLRFNAFSDREILAMHSYLTARAEGGD
jgi:cytochrome c553